MTLISPKNEGKDQNITEQSKIKTTKTIYPFTMSYLKELTTMQEGDVKSRQKI